MYCEQRSQYTRLNSKKNSFRGNYSRKYGKCKRNQKKCGRNSRCVKKRKSCPRGYNGRNKQKGKKGRRCCCKKRPYQWEDCEEFVGYGCLINKNQCGKNGQCRSNKSKCPKSSGLFVNCCGSTSKMLQLLSLKDSTTKIGSNMDMYYTESKMALDYGNTVYRDSTSGI